MNVKHLRLLQDMPIFGGVSDETLNFICENNQNRQVKAGDYFFYEGDIATSMFVLEHGGVAVYRKWLSLDYKLRELVKGDCFGEMALMSFSHRSASVKAMENCSALEISVDQLRDVYTKFPDQYTIIQMNMGREVCRRLRDSDHRLFLNDLEKFNLYQSGHAYKVF